MEKLSLSPPFFNNAPNELLSAPRLERIAIDLKILGLEGAPDGHSAPVDDFIHLAVRQNDAVDVFGTSRRDDDGRRWRSLRTADDSLPGVVLDLAGLLLELATPS